MQPRKFTTLIAAAALISGGGLASAATPTAKPADKPSAQASATPASKPSAATVKEQKQEQKQEQGARTALRDIDRAVASLDKGQTSAAKTALKDAVAALEPLYLKSPSSRAVAKMGETQAKLSASAAGPVDFVPLETVLGELQSYVNPQVLAHTQQAKEKAKAGHNAAAKEELRMAEDTLVADQWMLPVEDTYARVLAAQALLNQGRIQPAHRMLNGISLVMDELQVSRPLLGVRTDLAAAADAADHSNWTQAQQLLGDAHAQLSLLSKEAMPSVSPDIRGWEGRAAELSQKAASATKPQASAIRQLAMDIRSPNASNTGTGGAGSSMHEPSAPANSPHTP